jgi:hypothetical protein
MRGMMDNWDGDWNGYVLNDWDSLDDWNYFVQG